MKVTDKEMDQVRRRGGSPAQFANQRQRPQRRAPVETEDQRARRLADNLQWEFIAEKDLAN